MTKRMTGMGRSSWRRWWRTAIVVATLTTHSASASAQTVLRFVGPDSAPPNTAPLPAPVTPVAPAPQPCGSEFRFVELKEGKVAPLPQFSVSSREMTTSESSTLKFAPVATTRPSEIAVVQRRAAEMPGAKSLELRFKPLSRQAAVAASSATSPDVAATVAAPLASARKVCNPARPAIEIAPATQQIGSELFAHSQSQLNAFKPRIAVAVEHIPAAVPQNENALPVRSTREAAPTYAQAGTELFVSTPAPVVTAAPRQWELPALDYGAALREVKPPQPLVFSAKPIEPVRVVARELPSNAAGMFSLAAPQPLNVQPPANRATANVPIATPLPIVTASPIVVPRTVAVQPMSVQMPATIAKGVVGPKVARQEMSVTRSAPISSPPPVAIAKPAPIAAPVIAPRPVLAPATPQVVSSEPVVAPLASQRIAAASPKSPAAAELTFSNLPEKVELRKPQFVSAEPVSTAPPALASAPVVQQQLVPTSVAQPSQSKLPFAYQSGPLASEPHVEEYKPVEAAPPVAQVSQTTARPQAPERSRVTAAVDPQDPNTYSFSFASSSKQTSALLANSVEPTVAEGLPVGPSAEMPSALPAPCACGAGADGGQGGCPYLPGQSGTRALCGVECGRYGAPCCSTWSDATCIPWALFGPGEYVGPARPAHVETYFLRVNDFITLTFIESRKKSAEHYRIGVGDRLQIEWLQGAANEEFPLNRELLVQPDGTVTLPLIGETMAAGKTVNEFREEVVKLFGKYQRDPQITVTPLTVNVAVQDVLKAVTAKNQSSGQTQDVRVTPEGTIQAAGIGSVYVQGLTLDELRSELEARYAAAYGPGLAVSPQLTERAVSYVFLGGEVKAPGRYTLEGPTTVMQSIAMAGGWNIGGNVRQVVVFRRDENWCLKATKIDVRAPLYGNDPCPVNDVWLRENDLVLVPKTKILCATDMINLYFTRGVYAVFPINYVYDFSQNSGIVPIP